MSRELKDEILAVIDARVAEKEEQLWRRGQVEIHRLQKEQQEIRQTVNKLVKGQNRIDSELKKHMGALLNLTQNFETLASEMKQVCKSLPKTPLPSHLQLETHQSPAPSHASTAIPDSGTRQRRHLPTPLSVAGGVDTSAISCASDLRPTSTRASREQRWQTGTPAQQVRSSLHSLVDEEEQEDPQIALFQSPHNLSMSTGGAADVSAISLPGLPLSPTGTTAEATLEVSAIEFPLEGALDASDILNVSDVSVRAPEGVTPKSSDGGLSLPAPPPAPQQVAAAALDTVPEPPAVTRTNSGLVLIEVLKEPGFVTLGIEVNESDNDGCLTVEGIDDTGLFARHNAQQQADWQKMHVGDCVVAVNDAKGDAERMLKECRERQRLQFWIRRGEQRLRPEARPFVPAAGSAPMPPPPGLGAEAAVSRSAAANAPQAGPKSRQGDVKRALFS